ncbi:hypothetical protein [Amycolatopsis magusensis]|uniref:hypothetical protein n=1 Tax=Amycolatopsis magusensis TaxID=882444 RepID=UPI0037B57409
MREAGVRFRRGRWLGRFTGGREFDADRFAVVAGLDRAAQQRGDGARDAQHDAPAEQPQRDGVTVESGNGEQDRRNREKSRSRARPYTYRS